MVDRYSIAQNPLTLIQQKGAWQPNFNAHPTQKLPILKDLNTLSYYHWGLMAKWSNNKVMSSKLFNLAVDRAFEKTSFKKSLQNRRCLAIADGFYLWRQIGKKQHTPYYHYLPNQHLFGIAGIWESSEDLEGRVVECFMCLVQQLPASGNASEEKPTVILQRDFSTWLDQDVDERSIRNLISKSEEVDFSAHAVSPAIKNVRNNSERLIEPAMPADQHGNYTLF